LALIVTDCHDIGSDIGLYVSLCLDQSSFKFNSVFGTTTIRCVR